jgi:hypothetical protein
MKALRILLALLLAPICLHAHDPLVILYERYAMPVKHGMLSFGLYLHYTGWFFVILLPLMHLPRQHVVDRPPSIPASPCVTRRLGVVVQGCGGQPSEPDASLPNVLLGHPALAMGDQPNTDDRTR